MSRKSLYETQRSLRTNSSSIIAIWAAGPPKAVVPNRRNESAICFSSAPGAASRAAVAVPAVVSCGGGRASSFIFE